MDFQDQTVLVTGAAGNLGQAVARAFAQRGAKLVLVDRRREALERVFGADNESQILAAVDLLDAAQVAGAVDEAVGRFGAIDVVCNIAGGFDMGPAVHETTDEMWNRLFDLNARTVLQVARAAVPKMKERGRGRIVNVAANAAQKGAAGMGAYCASKDVVVRMTESMAAELREHGINVNCVMPSIIDTPEN
ncbi:MAG TPA: SDR family NAD(P)-dependent oxidoreductase, partial [Noviherbaspirillum sp.]|nr:SDR family NAD(P)-dependent oxidoreductase [Noviherbaspirillum sp.]